jgi:hypothetical protein
MNKSQCSTELPCPDTTECSGNIKQLFYLANARKRKDGTPVANLQNAKAVQRLIKLGKLFKVKG